MASTAEAVRDQAEAPAIPPMLARPEEAKAPTEDAPLKSFGDIASGLAKMGQEMMPSRAELDTAKENATVAREKAARSAQDFADAQAPLIEQARKEGERFADEAQHRQQPIQQTGQAVRQQIAQQPSRGLRPFLATSPNEPPEASITKLITGIAAFAQMIGGGRAGARGALSAMTGAIEGWQAGDKQRADRQFSDWKARTEAMLDDWAMELRSYESWFKAGGMPLEQMKLGLELDARRFGNQRLADEIRSGTADEALKHLEKRQDAATKILESSAKMIGAKETADSRIAQREQEYQKTLDYKLRLLEEKREQRKKVEESSGLTEETLNRLAELRARGAAPGSLVKGWGEGARRQMAEIENRASKILATRGDPAGAQLLAQASLKANQAALTDLAKKEANWSVFANTFEPGVKQLYKIADAVDGRTGMPVFDKWLLRSRLEYAGDPQVAALNSQMELVANEAARVITRQGVTTEASRAEQRDKMNMARTPEQLRQIIEQSLKPDVEFARAAFESEKAGIMRAIVAPPTPPGPEAAKARAGPAKTYTTPSGVTVTVTEK